MHPQIGSGLYSMQTWLLYVLCMGIKPTAANMALRLNIMRSCSTEGAGTRDFAKMVKIIVMYVLDRNLNWFYS